MNKFGDGLVTLLALLLGLGSLNLAFHGLMDGTISGSAGAEFAFAKKPIKFILIELFWVGLAGVLLLAAWRGTWGKSVDPGDLDEDPEPMDSQPIRRGINTRAHDAIADTVPMPLSSIAVPPKAAFSQPSSAPCEFSPLRSHSVIGVKAPQDCRRNGATRFAA